MKTILPRVVRQTSLKTKLRLFTMLMLLPLVVVVYLLLGTISKYNGQYNLIVRNVTVASEFNMDFKEKLDYKMYRYYIGGKKDLDEYAPFDDIDAARRVVRRLEQTTTRPDSLQSLRYIDHFLTNLENNIKSSVFNSGYDDNMANLENNIQGLTELIADQMHSYIYYETQEIAELQQRTNQQISRNVYMIGCGTVALFLTLWVLAMIISSGITRPIEELSDNIKLVGEGDFTVRPVTTSSDEIQALSETFDTLVSHIGDLVAEGRREQQNLRRTELQLLQAQINPHFLYNTFDTIIWLAEDHQTQQVVEMTTSLSSFFRTTLSKGRDFITLREEELHVRSYLEIQQTRYRDILSYEIHIPTQFSELTVPKLTLQPLVENALYHGIKHKRGMGRITVTGRQEGELLLLSVTDNGIGMDREQLEQLRRSLDQPGASEGFGCVNVHERIQLYFGTDYGVTLESVSGQGTTVTVTLPSKIIQPFS